jgi:hypothetical protein
MLTAMVSLISMLGTVRAEIKTLPLSAPLMALTKTAIIETTKRRSREMGNHIRWLTSASPLRLLRRWAGDIPMKEATYLAGALLLITGPAAESRC